MMTTSFLKTCLLIAALALVGVAFSVQLRNHRSLEHRLQDLEQRIAPAPSAPEPSSAPERGSPRAAPSAPDVPRMDMASWDRRLLQLEEALERMNRATEHRMDQGDLPPSPEKLAEWAARFADVSASDRDRLAAFRLLRRNGGISDGLLGQAFDWLRTSTNAGTRRDILRQMEGLSNPALKDPLLSMLATETSSGVREELIESLQAFAADPGVEAHLWDRLRYDPDDDVREEAADALSGYIDPERGAADPLVQEWLQYVATNDEDSDVRREASRALGIGRR